MSHVSLILPISSKTPLVPEQVAQWREALGDAGHGVEVLVVGTCDDPSALQPGWRTVATEESGLAAIALAGLKQAQGEILLVLDPAMGYTADDLCRLTGVLAQGEVELAVASRFVTERNGTPAPVGRRLRAWAGLVVRPLAGTSDPLSGLIGLTRDLAQRLASHLRPLGTKFAVEVLARADDRFLEVPAGARWPSGGPRLEFDDLRQLKRLADHRFGNFSRLIQFCAVGASGMVVDLSCYALFQYLFKRSWLAGQVLPVVGTPVYLALSAALAIGIALTWNFSLNRRLTFSYARQGSIVRQFVTYVLSNLLAIALNFSLRLILPEHFLFFNHHKLAAAVVGIVMATGISFSMSRWLVFSHRAHTPAPPKAPPSGRLDTVAALPLGEE